VQARVCRPSLIKPALAPHVATFTGSLSDSLVFTSPTGVPLRHADFRRRVPSRVLRWAGLACLESTSMIFAMLHIRDRARVLAA